MIAADGVTAYKESKGRGAVQRQRQEAGARPHRRAEPRLAAALSALDRLGRPAHGRAGGRAGQADRAGGHGGEAAHGRGEPAPGRLDREVLSRPGAELPRPDPGGVAGTDPGGREVRLPAGIQVLDLRDLVDPPGGDPRARRQVADDPDPGPHGREAQPGRARRAASRAAAGARAGAARDRGRARLDRAGRTGGPSGQPDAGVAGEAGGGRGRLGARGLRGGRQRRVPVRDGFGEPAAGGRAAGPRRAAAGGIGRCWSCATGSTGASR